MTNKFLNTIIERFPGRELEILKLSRDNSDFLSVCEEIEIAEAAFERWKDDPNRASEYRSILDRLEREFTNFLNARAT